MKIESKSLIIFVLIYSVFTYFYKGVFQPRSGRKTDFESYYTASVALKNNINPYDRVEMNTLAEKYKTFHYDLNKRPVVNKYVYPPLLAQLIIPLSFFNINTARFLWSSIINFIFFILLLFYIHKIFKAYNITVLFFCMLALFNPLYKTLAMGQVNLLILLLIVMSYYYLKINAPLRFSVSFCLSVLIKIVPVILLGFLAFKRKWKLLIFSIAFFVVIIGVSGTLSSFSYYKNYFFKELPGFSSASRPQVKNQSLRRSVFRTFGQNRLTDILVKTVKFLSLVMLVYFLLYRKDRLMLFNFSILTVILLQNTLWEHHLLVTIFPMLALILANMQQKQNIIVFFIAISFCIMGIDYKYFDPRLAKNILVLLQSSKFIGFFLLYVLYIITLFKLE